MARADLDALFKKAEKAYNTTIGSMDSITTNTQFLTTGNLGIDYVLGGGIPLGRTTELAGASSSGKAQRWTDVVHTPDRGYVQIKDLKVGDRLSAPSGGESVLKGIFPQGPKEMFRFTFSDGTNAVSTASHLWSVDTQTKHLGLTRVTVEAQDIINAMEKESYRPRDINLPSHEPVTSDEADLPLDPYLLGALLGDGSIISGSLMITSMDQEIIDRVESRLPAGVQLVFSDKRGRATTYRLSRTAESGPNPLTEILRSLGVWGHGSLTKFVPEPYLDGSFEQRLALLQGLMDTDGYDRSYLGASSRVQNAIFYTSSEQLSKDVAFLARSLGAPAYIRDKIPTYVYKGVKLTGAKAYSVTMGEMVHKGFSVFHLERKRPMGTEKMRDRRRQFVSVERIGVEEAVCISVSSEDHLYFTNDFIPTHNTTTALQAAADLQRIIIAGGDEEKGIFADDVILYMDYEHAMDKSYAKSLGLNVNHDSFAFSQPDTLEEGAEIILRAVETGSVRLVIVDSVAAMQPRAIKDSEVGKATIGVVAKLLKEFGTSLNPIAHENNCAVVFINHEYDQIGGFSPVGTPQITAGGKALKYFASVRVSYRQKSQKRAKIIDPITKEEVQRPVATDVNIKVVKNKVAPPFRQTVARVRYGKGFDNFWAAVTILLSHKYIVYNSSFKFHRLEEHGLAPEWMTRAQTGAKAPYIKGEDNLVAAGDEHPEWADDIIAFATKVLESVLDSDEEIADEDDDEESEDLNSILGSPSKKIKLND